MQLRAGVLWLLLAFWPCFRLIPQQTPVESLHGTVFNAETSEPIHYGIIEISGHANRLTDKSGQFHVAALPAGKYHIVVRQIGFLPFDSTITIPTSSALMVRLKRLGVFLAPVTVSGKMECRRPGPPNPQVTPALVTIFEQLVINARRMRLLADEYPHILYVQRSLTDTPLPVGRVKTGVDTLTLRSEDRWPYRPGHIVGRVGYEENAFGRRIYTPWEEQDLVRLPTLVDFADSSFVSSHCFQLVGRDTLQGEQFVRIDFRPTIRLKTSDVSGTAYLDSATYLIRYVVVDMTHPGQGVPGLIFLGATSRFHEAAPGILVTDWILAKSRGLTNQLTDRNQLFDRVEEQRLLQVQFLRRPSSP